jgi:hypothetical protein
MLDMTVDCGCCLQFDTGDREAAEANRDTIAFAEAGLELAPNSSAGVPLGAQRAVLAQVPAMTTFLIVVGVGPAGEGTGMRGAARAWHAARVERRCDGPGPPRSTPTASARAPSSRWRRS